MQAFAGFDSLSLKCPRIENHRVPRTAGCNSRASHSGTANQIRKNIVFLKVKMLASKISSKGQVTLPKEVRRTLRAQPGDLIEYSVEHGVVTLRRIEPIDLAYHAALTGTLSEWESPEDDEAFADL